MEIVVEILGEDLGLKASFNAFFLEKMREGSTYFYSIALFLVA